MINYYLNPQAYEEKGIDYDFFAMLEYNPQDYHLIQVNKVLAVIEGENDRADWHWVVDTTKGIYYTRGGCDYTGWDCQSWSDSSLLGPVFDNRKLALAMEAHRSGEEDAEMLGIYTSLMAQIAGEKARTWRDVMDDEFGLS